MLKHIIIRDFADNTFCDQVVEAYNFPDTPVSLFLADGDDNGNVKYASQRSDNLFYKYVMGLGTFAQKEKLFDMTGLNFHDGISAMCLPVFAYGEGGEIKAHRGVRKDTDTEKYQEFVAVLMLTQRGVDFEGGNFYLNYKAQCSADGKTVTNDDPEDRFYPNLDKGDLIIFHNPSVVHGVETVEGNGAFRATCSWRSNDIQTTPIMVPEFLSDAVDRF